MDNSENAGRRTKSNYIMERDIFNILTAILAGLCLYAGIVYAVILRCTKPIIYANLLVCIAICVGVRLMNKKLRNLRLLTIVMVMYIELVLMPIFMIYGVEISSSTPIWFAGSIIGFILMLEIKDIWWVFLIVLYWNTYLYFKNYIWSGFSSVISDRWSYFFGYAFSFASIAISLSYVLLKIERNISKVEKEIDKSREIEKNAGLAKARFLANMSHEIRTPMNSIIGLTELALREEMSDGVRNEVTIIKNAAYDLLEIIDDVLMYSKLDSGKVKLVDVDFCFDEILKQVFDTVSANTYGKDIKVRVKIDHNIPKVVRGDDIRIKQVLMSFVFISLYLTQNGRLMINIDSERNENDTRVLFKCAVLDTGCGLSKFDLDAICEAYDTYDPRQNSNLKGISLKFIICKKLLELMGGSMEVRSIEGVGLESSFTFECGISDSSPMIGAIEGEKKAVLIYVDDNREHNTWKLIMEGFKIRPDFVDSCYSFNKAVKEKLYDYIFVPSTAYDSVSGVLSTFSCEDKTYVIADAGHYYGDFEKCRIIRHPVSSMNVSDVLNDRWNIDDYIKKNEAADIDISKAKILVVDDNSVNLKVAIGLFNAYNAKIDIAKSGEEALAKLAAGTYNIVFMDMVMPEMSGEETLKRMRESDKASTKNVPVIALTANIGMNIREEILDKGFQEYVAKPIRQRYLSRILVTFLPPELVKSKAKEKTTPRRSIAEKQIAVEDNLDILKADPAFSEFAKAVKEMDLEAITASLNELKKKAFAGAAGLKIDEAAAAFDNYDFKKLNPIADMAK